MQTICFLATCQSQHILCTHCWVELSLMLSTLLYFIIVILILLVINRCLINCSHYLIYFAIVNSFLYVLFVGIPTCSKPVTSPPRFLHDPHHHHHYHPSPPPPHHHHHHHHGKGPLWWPCSSAALQRKEVLIQLKRTPRNRCLHKFSLITLKSEYLL